MAVWLSRRFRRWLLFTVGVPVIGWTLGRAGEELERRRGRSTSSDLLQSGGDMLNRRRRATAGSHASREPDGDQRTGDQRAGDQPGGGARAGRSESDGDRPADR